LERKFVYLKPNSKITVFLESLGGGGAEQAVVTLMNAFVDRGYEVELVLCKSGGVLQKQLSGDIMLVEFHSANLYFCFPKLVSFLRDKNPQTLLTTLDLASAITLLARRVASAQTRVVIRIANTVSVQKRTFFKKKMERFLLSIIYAWADDIVAVAKGVADDLAAYTGIPRDRIRHIYNPVITPRLMKMIEQPLQHPWFQDGQVPVILGVGRLTRQKGFENLILAFSKIYLKYPSRLMILGEGEQRDALEALSAMLGLTGVLSMPGFVNNPFPYMKKAAVFVLSSEWEGLPAVLIQALACGCPSVSTDCPSGPSEILDQGRYGILVPVGDVNAMSAAIKSALTKPIPMPDAEWLEQFSYERVVNQYLEILDK
jgi:glycosyltransferase involved in cell wall biosynthesis